MKDAWENWPSRFKAALTAYKQDTGRTDSDIAAAAEVSRQAIGHWANGIRTPELGNFFRICKAIQADPMQILFGVKLDDTLGNVIEFGDRRRDKENQHIAAIIMALRGMPDEVIFRCMKAVMATVHEHETRHKKGARRSSA